MLRFTIITAHGHGKGDDHAVWHALVRHCTHTTLMSLDAVATSRSLSAIAIVRPWRIIETFTIMQRTKVDAHKKSLIAPLSKNNSQRGKLKLSSFLMAAFGVPLAGFCILACSFVFMARTGSLEENKTTEIYRRGSNPDSPNSALTTKVVNKNDVKYHIIFSTGCSTFQDWQSYVFFHGAMTSGQPGTVTRIVSGCSADDEMKLRAIFAEQIAPMAPGRFKIHFTPDYSKLKPSTSYKYWNKPYGLKHWLENALGFPDDPVDEDSIVALLDPDQLILRPFTNNDFSNTHWKFIKEGQIPRDKIEHGKPMGQLYGFGLQWKQKIDMSKVTKDHSPVDDMPDTEARAGYIVGPPYIATARDMYRISLRWTDFAVPVHDQYPNLLAEMFAYCLGAAHLRLAHQTAASFMVSSVVAKGEGWEQYVDKIPVSEVCEKQDPSRYPNVLHFCQRYGLGPFFFGKYRFPKNFLSCEAPLLKEPPKTLALDFSDAKFPGGDQPKSWSPKIAKRNAFMLCQMLPALNAAAEYFKRKHCDPSTANFNKTFLFT